MDRTLCFFLVFVVMGCNERVESVVEPRFQGVQVGDHDLLRFWLRVQVLGGDLIALQHILDQRPEDAWVL